MCNERTAAHPLARVFAEVAAGQFPPPDVAVDLFDPPPGYAGAVVGFTAHHCIAAGLQPEAVLERLGGVSAPLGPAFLDWLGDALGSAPSSLTLLLLAPTEIDGDVEPLVPCAELGDHPRVVRAARFRSDVRAYTDDTGAGIVVVGRGLAQRWETSVEVELRARNRGLGRRLACAARSIVPQSEPLWAQVAPANAASVRTFLAAGYRPVGAEVLFPGVPAGGTAINAGA